MRRSFSSAFLSLALLLPVAAPFALRADDRSYHDKDHNDEHHWDSKEDRAYRSWAKENRRKYVTFNKLKENDQQAYWAWRHQHGDDDHRDHH